MHIDYDVATLAWPVLRLPRRNTAMHVKGRDGDLGGNLFVVETPGQKEMSKWQKIAEGKQMAKLNTFIKGDGTPTLPGRETPDFLIKQHFPSSKETVRVRYKHISIETNSLDDKYVQ